MFEDNQRGNGYIRFRRRVYNIIREELAMINMNAQTIGCMEANPQVNRPGTNRHRYRPAKKRSAGFSTS